MIYKPEHVVDLETGAIVDVVVRPGDAADGSDLAKRLLEVEERMNVVVAHAAGGEAGGEADGMIVETVVADMGYFALGELEALQEVGILTAVADPVGGKRRVEKLSEAHRRSLQRAKRTMRSRSGKRLMRRRGELCERSFVHVLDSGGARRTTLRGRENITKRYRIQAACGNLSLLLRHITGIGTLKQSWAASREARTALVSVLRALLSLQLTPYRLVALQPRV